MKIITSALFGVLGFALGTGLALVGLDSIAGFSSEIFVAMVAGGIGFFVN